VERLDGSLAPVTYLFAARSAPADPALDEIENEIENEIEDDSPEYSEWARGGASNEQSRRFPGNTDSHGVPPASLAKKAVHAPEERWAAPGIKHEPAHNNSKDVPVTESIEPTREERRAHNVGLNALTRKGQSVAEMTALLESRDLDEETVAAEIKRLKSVGLLDDFELAETLVRTLTERKGLGRSGIMNELRQRKINPVAIDSALEELDGDDELSRATEIAIKRAGQLSSYDATTAKRRLSAFLQRRGFSGSVVTAATNAALSRSSSSNSSGPRFV
jgi:regulatory protein